jgi:predicted anti-sigma-YlaC factor YlaD
MNCKQVRDNLSPYLDQVLSQEEVNLVEKHLEKCSSCRQELIDLKKNPEFDSRASGITSAGEFSN